MELFCVKDKTKQEKKRQLPVPRQKGVVPVDNFEVLREGKVRQLGNAVRRGVLDEWITGDDLAEQL